MVRTIFLLRYLSSVELRHTIQAATNKSEAFNRFVQWVCFGGDGVIAENVRDEQRKFIKYNHLVANLLTFHTLVTITSALRQQPPRSAVLTYIFTTAFSRRKGTWFLGMRGFGFRPLRRRNFRLPRLPIDKYASRKIPCPFRVYTSARLSPLRLEVGILAVLPIPRKPR